MTSKKLGNLLREVPPTTSPAAEMNTGSGTNRRNLPIGKQDNENAPRSPESPLQVLVPAHVRKQVNIMQAESGESLRTIVLRGLRALGVDMTEEEMRGTKGKGASFLNS